MLACCRPDPHAWQLSTASCAAEGEDGEPEERRLTAQTSYVDLEGCWGMDPRWTVPLAGP